MYLPVTLFVQLADRTYIVAGCLFIAIGFLNHSFNEWFTLYKNPSRFGFGKGLVMLFYFSLAKATTMRRWGSVPVEKVVTWG